MNFMKIQQFNSCSFVRLIDSTISVVLVKTYLQGQQTFYFNIQKGEYVTQKLAFGGTFMYRVSIGKCNTSL